MSLLDYQRKRRFTKTREPEPGKPAPKGERALFVVQLHHASRRHYDFRLQVGDALKSWAVPKGPSYDPSVKRMAVEVEDHPVDYADFEGEIPKGEYGGGHVAQFDHGVWATEGDVEAQLAKGHLKFELFGDKLKGGWHLVRSGKPAKQPQWLLFKDKDAFAGTLEADDLLGDVTAPPAADAKRAGTGKSRKAGRTGVTLATRKRRRGGWTARAAKLTGVRKVAMRDAFFPPQLAKAGTSPPPGEDWLHEIKWDGYRLVATVVDGRARLWSRNAIEWTAKVPELVAALEALGVRDAALDGELIAGRGTQADFNLLQATLSGERQGALAFALFDLLHLDGVDVSAAPLIERKALLAELLEPAVPHLAYSSHIEGEAEEAFRLASESGFEGLISKRASAPYRPGRGDDWRKSKRIESDEFAVIGATAPKGSRTGFGSLLLARADGQGGWTYAGRVGSGFTDAMLETIATNIGRAGGATPPLDVPGDDAELRRARWFAPRFVVEVFHRGIGGQGLLRQPSLKAVRADKSVDDLQDGDRVSTRRTKTAVAAAAKTAKARKASKASKATKATKATKARGATKSAGSSKTGTTKRTATREPPALTSPTKVLFPADRITKQQVFDYYAAVMPFLLPEVVGRPLSVIRCPAGTAQACFFQKHATPGLALADLVKLKEESGTNADYLVVRDAAAVLELVQFNTLEFHPWGAHAATPERADRVVFDLDPGPGVSFAAVKSAAVYLRDRLEEAGLVSFLRTSGGKGLHVVVPLNPGCAWDLVKRFAHGFAEALAAEDPLRFIATASLKLRKGRIFVDWLRNSRGATAVASYSLRARDGAPVAMPLRWNELATLKSPAQFTLKNTPARLKRRRVDPWADIDAVRQDLGAWADAD